MSLFGKSQLPELISIDAKPYTYTFSPKHTALLCIDMQRDFLLEKGFGQIQGGNLTDVQASIAPVKKLLDAFRAAGMPIIHTREGHKPDLSDCPSSKLVRQKAQPGNTQHMLVIGDKGELGRLLVQGEFGHDLVDELQPLPGEIVVDKPGKGTFWNTEIMYKLKLHDITHLFVTGVTTECCFSTSIREANDRGFECCGIEEATAGYNPSFKASSLDMIYWSQGLFGFTAKLDPLLQALAPYSKFTEIQDTPPITPHEWDGDLRISSLLSAYRNGLSPTTIISTIYEKIEAYSKINPGVWIDLEKKESVLQQARLLIAKFPNRNALPPLFGIPFSVKDSINVAGRTTTTACPPLAFVAPNSAPVYTSCVENGALYIGKVNLDQLATGLSGQRSPYGAPSSALNSKYISGGSSSGSCVSVGASLVSFSLATDTAGSGRVPSAFNGVVGYKPTRGLLSFQEVTPACLSLDCIALITKTVSDARTVFSICENFDVKDRYSKRRPGFDRHINSIGPQASKFKFGIPPPEALAVCAPVYRKLFYETIKKLQALGGELKPIDWSPFEKAGKLLYDGTFVSERFANLPDGWFDENRESLHPVLQKLFGDVIGRNSTAIQAYRDMQEKALLTRQVEEVFGYSEQGVDVIIVPTAPTHWKVEELLADPIKRNSHLGEFTHFGNVLDLCAVACPAGTFKTSELSGDETDEGILPFSITFLGGSRLDADVLRIAGRFQEMGEA